MCLKHHYPKPIPKNMKYGYKIFELIYDEDGNDLIGYNSEIYQQISTKIYKLNEWIRDKETYNIKCGEGDYWYETGFHIFTRLKDAKEWYDDYLYETICKVEFRNPVAYGVQEILKHTSWDKPNRIITTPVIVAKEMKIIKDMTEE